MNFQLWLFNKNIINRTGKFQAWLPLLIIAIDGPRVPYGKKEMGEFNDEYREVGFVFPMHLLITKSDINVSFSIAFGLMLTVNYQWSY